MRRDDVFPQLGKDIRQIRFNIPKKSKTLFGEDVSKRIASIKKMQRDIRTSSSYASTPHYYKSKKSSYTPYNSSSSTPYNSKNMKSFPSKQLIWEEEQEPIQQELKVSDTDIKKLHDLAEKCKAGNIKLHLENWKKLTNDKYILSIVQHGLKVNFNQQPISNSNFEHPRNKREIEILGKEIKKLLKKGVIKEAITRIERERFSNIFLRPKPDDSFRMILNLKKLNECVEAPPFKMESIKNALCMTEPGVWMASVDLKDAFFTIHIKGFLIPYEFSSMPNGYSDAMRVFTKVFKPAFSYLRGIGYCARRDIQKMFAKHYRNCKVVTISWVYNPPRKICAKTHTKINIFRICLEFQNYDSHFDRCQKRKKISNWGKES